MKNVLKIFLFGVIFYQSEVNNSICFAAEFNDFSSQTYSVAKIFRFCNLAILPYERDERIINETNKLLDTNYAINQDIYIINTDDLKCVITYSNINNAIIVAFRGTNSLRNWRRDFNARLDDFQTNNINGNVHRGFKQAVDTLYDSIKSNLSTHLNQEIIFTGHSLGAALATLTAAKFVNDEEIRPHLIPNQIKIFGLSEPCVGDDDFINSLNSTILNEENAVNHIRLYVHADPITYVSRVRNRAYRVHGLGFRLKYSEFFKRKPLSTVTPIWVHAAAHDGEYLQSDGPELIRALLNGETSKKGKIKNDRRQNG